MRSTAQASARSVFSQAAVEIEAVFPFDVAADESRVGHDLAGIVNDRELALRGLVQGERGVRDIIAPGDPQQHMRLQHMGAAVRHAR